MGDLMGKPNRSLLRENLRDSICGPKLSIDRQAIHNGQHYVDSQLHEAHDSHQRHAVCGERPARFGRRC